jgi:hypothetical protein
LRRHRLLHRLYVLTRDQNGNSALETLAGHFLNTLVYLRSGPLRRGFAAA